jgi:tetratricopeptide (TPR) repeat protein
LILDIILKNDWKRPIYFLNTNTLSKIGLDKYIHREGLSFRLLPFAADSSNKISNSDYLYTKFMNEFRTGGMDDENIMLDWTNVRIVSTMRIREQFNNAARLLISEGDNKRAVEVLDKCLDVLPNEKISYGISFPQIIESYNLAGEKEKAEELYQIFRKNILNELDYYKRFDEKMIPGLSNNIRMNLYLLKQLEKVRFVKTMHENEVINDLNEYYGYFYKILG